MQKSFNKLVMLISIGLIFIFSLSGCAGQKVVEATELPSQLRLAGLSPTPFLTIAAPQTTEINVPLTPDSASAEETPLPKSPEGAEPLPAEPRQIEFQSADGETLRGMYYPAAQNPAPLIILMHWAPGDQNDWSEIAYWLQNRGLGSESGGASPDMPWKDRSWFPVLGEEKSFAVFTFTFRGCEGGCKDFSPTVRQQWLSDAQSAVLKASELEGIIPGQIVMVGASIGADGAADGCAYLNTVQENTCQGAFSLSPGDYLRLPYIGTVSNMGGKPAWCLFSTDDTESAQVCKQAAGDNYKPIEYAGSAHGMSLIAPDVDPNPLHLLLDFLALVIK